MEPGEAWVWCYIDELSPGEIRGHDLIARCAVAFQFTHRLSAKFPTLADFCLSHIWRDWRPTLVIVKPETVLAWHRKGFRLFWTWKVRHGQPGRPVVDREVRDLLQELDPFLLLLHLAVGTLLRLKSGGSVLEQFFLPALEHRWPQAPLRYLNGRTLSPFPAEAGHLDRA